MKTIGVVILAVLIVTVTSRIPRYHRKLSDERDMFLFMSTELFSFYQWAGILLLLLLKNENLIELGNNCNGVCAFIVKLKKFSLVKVARLSTNTFFILLVPHLHEYFPLLFFATRLENVNFHHGELEGTLPRNKL